MPIATSPSREQAKERRERAREWREFRAAHLYSQDDLAAQLGCARRTISSIEGGREVVHPRPSLLRKFRLLKLRCEAELRELNRRIGEVA